jgi:hypothetical protein
MRNRSVLTAILTVSIALPCLAGKPGGGGGGGNTTPSVTSTIHDAPVVGAPYRIRSDYGLTGNNTYYNGVDSVISQLPNWYELSALESSERKMFVDFGDPVVDGTAVPDGALGGASSGYVKGRLLDRAGGTAAMSGVGSTLTNGFAFIFLGTDGATYQVRMNSANEPGTENALFTCTAVDSSNACVAWTVTPAGVGGKSIGRLVKSVVVKGHTQLTYYGDFYMTFEVTFTKP